MDAYDILYENVPHFCFSCDQLGHSDLYVLHLELEMLMVISLL